MGNAAKKILKKVQYIIYNAAINIGDATNNTDKFGNKDLES